MTVDQTGSLVNTKRHDYLPFGEELQAGTGGRTTAQGYSQQDGVRQGFTGYEKDGETGLNFAQARYFSPTQGRFTSPDEPLIDQLEDDPQSWNLYSYVRNNPLAFTDPTGLWRRQVIDGTTYWIADKEGDNFEGLAEILGVTTQSLLQHFRAGGGDSIQLNEQFDIDNYNDHQNQQYYQAMSSPGSGFPHSEPAPVPTGNDLRDPSKGNALQRGLATAREGWNDYGAGTLMTMVPLPLPNKIAVGGKLLQLAAKIIRQAPRRGWTEKLIKEAVASGAQFPAVNKINPANGATRYVHPTTGQSVVVDKVTNEIIHVGGPGFKY